IESVQRRFTKSIPFLHHLSYLSRLHAVGMDTLERRRLISDLCLLYKILHNLVQTDLNSHFISSLYLSTQGHQSKLRDFNISDNSTKYFYCNQIIRI
ncbi:hypothetical protein HELRODRAFT_67951, partial [Helobdella robusta]|uniref:Uncharacterized protein n=1 Tax=Helobdella robusta TaxID=6412 RepID=T1FZ84_HELRO